jgi:hypothetical protein
MAAALPRSPPNRPADPKPRLRIPLIADTHSKLIADSIPGDRGHLG